MASPRHKRPRLEESPEQRSPSTASSSTIQGFGGDLNMDGTFDDDPTAPVVDNSAFNHSRKYAALKPDLELYYDASALTIDNEARRALRILALKTTSTEEELNPCTKLSPGWNKSKQVINLFLEAGIPTPLQKQCHLQFSSDKSSITGGDIRRQLALHLGIDDIFTIQLEFQRQPSRINTNMIKHSEGTCRRVRGQWNDITLDDRKSVDISIPSSESSTSGDHLWVRVSNAEYIVLDTPERDQMVALTPDREANVGDIRAMAGKLHSIKPEAIHLQIFEQELLLDDFPLFFQGIAPQMTISCWFEYVECAICGDDDIPYMEFATPITANCIDHTRQTCTGCVQQWIATKLDSGDWERVACPGSSCTEMLQHDDMKRLATAEQFERYQHLSFRAALGSMPDFVWCLAPGCESGQVHDEGIVEFDCIACGTKSCVSCNRMWHTGETCTDYKLRTGTDADREKASEEEVEKISKECPGCKMRIQKDGGCEHITCRKCHHQFCWLCLASYQNGAVTHNATCMYHGGRVPDPHAMPIMGQRLGGNHPMHLRRPRIAHAPVLDAQPPFLPGNGQYYGPAAPMIPQQWAREHQPPPYQPPPYQPQQAPNPAPWNPYGAYLPPPHVAGIPQVPQVPMAPMPPVAPLAPIAAQAGQGYQYQANPVQAQLQEQQMNQQMVQQQVQHQARMLQIRQLQLHQQQRVQQQQQHVQQQQQHAQQQRAQAQQQQMQFQANRANQVGGDIPNLPAPRAPFRETMQARQQAVGQMEQAADRHVQQHPGQRLPALQDVLRRNREAAAARRRASSEAEEPVRDGRVFIDLVSSDEEDEDE